MNGKETKNRIDREQKAYEILNEQAKKLLEGVNISINRKHITQVINWLETNECCAYCGEHISLDKLL